MNTFRILIVGLVVVALIGLPSMVAPSGTTWDSSTAQAAPAEDRHPERRNANRNDNNGNGNDNDRDDNESDEHDGGDGGDGGGRHRPTQGMPEPSAPAGQSGGCFAAGQGGSLSLVLPGGTVRLAVVPTSTFGRDSRVTLSKVDPAAVPATSGQRLDDIVFELRAQDGCNGGGIGELPADANLGLAYAGGVTPGLTFAILDGDRWTPVPTVADPGASNAYISATVRKAGTYAVYRAP
ncbi:MAG: hypothetical protein IT306_19715 [Chloroflexi bacterium]|nr:hypothetical protein [Chloroflexota bacterium]